MKLQYQADLRTAVDEDNNIMGLWKRNYDIVCCIWHVSGMVFHESSNTGLLMEEIFSKS
jgi:hypothetical protein